MSYLLNIGLARNDGAGTIEADEVLRDLAAFELLPVSNGLTMSDTGATLIVNVAQRPLPATVDFICRKYKQDCFAVYNLFNGEGELVGPKARERGEFNPELFFTAPGVRLAPCAALFPLEV